MASDAAAYQSVLNYLTKMNRPYSVTDIFTNLGSKEVNKTAAVRVLTKMAEEKKVIEKAYGKQKIYYVSQDQFGEVSDQDLKQLDSEISNLTATLNEIQAMTNNAEKETSALSKSVTTSEAKAELKKIEAELPALEKRLDALKSDSSVAKVDPKEKAKLQSLNEKYSGAWRKRKLMANDMLNAILENYPKPKKVLMEELSIETDEDKN